MSAFNMFLQDPRERQEQMEEFWTVFKSSPSSTKPASSSTTAAPVPAPSYHTHSQAPSPTHSVLYNYNHVQSPIVALSPTTTTNPESYAESNNNGQGSNNGAESDYDSTESTTSNLTRGVKRAWKAIKPRRSSSASASSTSGKSF